MSWELHLLDSTFVIAVGQAALLSPADKSKVFFKCLNRWLPRCLEVKIKTHAWGFKAQNAIYSSSLISSGILAWGLMVLEAHARSSRNNSIMVIHNFEVANSIKAFHCVQHCTCKSWLKRPKLYSEYLQKHQIKIHWVKTENLLQSVLKTLCSIHWQRYTELWSYTCGINAAPKLCWLGSGLSVKNYLEKTNFCSFASV